MKIAVTDIKGSGIMLEFAKAIGARIEGRFFHIPSDKGAGYLTGFSFGEDLRMMIRNYYLNEQIEVDRVNELAEGQDYVIVLLSGIFPSFPFVENIPQSEPPSVFICRQEVSSQLIMQSNTFFKSITIAVSRKYLEQIFGSISHPVIAGILRSPGQFAFEANISPEMVQTASEMLNHSFPESIESHYYRLKCEELLCQVFSLLMQREPDNISGVHIRDIQAIYSIKMDLQSNLDIPPNIATLSKKAGMSEPKMRKLFKQIFGKGIFEYYQTLRMKEAARLLVGKMLSVSEVGYQLGFTNMSHFSRVFEQHLGLTPKKYSSSF